MIVWIASVPRSGNTFFRVVMHHLYGVDTYAAFKASEVLATAAAEDLVGHSKLPEALAAAVAAGKPDQIRAALDQLEDSNELFVIKTHARGNELFGTNYRAILVVRDGRDACVSYANYMLDIPCTSAALNTRCRGMVQSKSGLMDRRAWRDLAKIVVMNSMKSVGLRRWLVSRRIDRLYGWAEMNRSWLDRKRKPVVVYFDRLIDDPIATVTEAVDKLGIGLSPRADASVPSFHELKKRFPSFFRKGRTGDWKKHFSPAQERMFMERNRDMMVALNFVERPPISPAEISAPRGSQGFDAEYPLQ